MISEKEYRIGFKSDSGSVKYFNIYATGVKQARNKILRAWERGGLLGRTKIISIDELGAEQMVMDFD